MRELAARYEQERLPSRHSTARMYRSWLRNHILPKWGDRPIGEVQPRPVELWLRQLNLSPKSKSHVRGMLHLLMEFAMWSGGLEISRNPVDLVVVKGATKRTRQPRSLTVDEFRKFLQHLEEPFRTMALLCVCFGLRISECLALKWCDVDWLNGMLRIEQGIVRQRVDDVKTIYSQKRMSIDAELLELLKTWKRTTQFPADGDWLGISRSARTIAVVLSADIANVPQGCKECRSRETTDSHAAPQLPLVVRRRGNPHRCAAETHAAYRYSHDDELVR